ncbi:MAG: response regulator, partial [Gammaproteobacteria bacterium]|nr:response regulator [Gammaproteobacteria bacterium]
MVVKQVYNKASDEDLLALKRHLSGAKILLVEDNIINQKLARKILSHAQINSVLARNGQEALEALENEDFDGVLMDLQMPVMNGYETTIELRKQQRFNELPIIALSASVMQDDILRIKEVKMTDYVTKPINVSELYTTLCKYVTPANPVEYKEKKEDSKQKEISIFVDPVENCSLVNFDLGLKNTLNNKTLYYDMVLNYLDSYNQLEQSVFKLKQEDEISATRRLIHTLKSAAATIGAEKLAKLSGDIEKDLNKLTIDDDHIKHQLSELYIMNQSVLEALTLYTQRYEEQNKVIEVEPLEVSIGLMEPLTITDIQFELAQITQHLEGSDIAAADGIKEIMQDIDDPGLLTVLKRALYLTN